MKEKYIVSQSEYRKKDPLWQSKPEKEAKIKKYLELFQPLFDDVCVIDNIGHLGPWNYMNHSYVGDSIVWHGKEQDLIYIHFSNFSPNYEEGTYEMAPRHGITETTVNPFVKKKYDEYFDTVKQMKELIS